MTSAEYVPERGDRVRIVLECQVEEGGQVFYVMGNQHYRLGEPGLVSVEKLEEPELLPVELTAEELKLIQEALGRMQDDDNPDTRHEYAALEALWQKIDTEIDSRDA